MSDAELRQKARDAIDAGRLPGRRPDGVWGGRGAGVECAVCGDIVKSDGLGFELEFEADGHRGRKSRALHPVHIGCFAAWEDECQSLPASSEDGTISSRVRHRSNRPGPS